VRVRSILIATVAMLLAAACRTPPPPSRVAVIGLDGATWDVARPLLAAGEMPHLAALIAHGVTATPVAEAPLFAPVVWTTLMTGVPPAQHGVENWALAGSGYRKVPALWSRLDAAGRASILVNVPGTWKAERLAHGVVVADVGMARTYVGGAGGGMFVDPTSEMLPRPYDKLANLLRVVSAPLRIGEWSDWVDVTVPDVEASVLRMKRVDASHVWVSPLYPADLGAGALWPRELAGELGTYLGVPYFREGPAWSAYPDEVPAIFAEHLAQTTEVQLAAAHRLLRTKPWDLFVCVDPVPDRIEHAYWREHDTAAEPALDPDRIARHHERVRDAYRNADRHLGEFVTHAAPAWIVVVSAHGFGPGATAGARGDHAPKGMLVVAGPGLGGDAGEIPLVDVAPTIACLLGLPSDGMTGATLSAVRRTHPGCR
jgi:Type I phosphodiesterase / nucleotide pyrophosphatase